MSDDCLLLILCNNCCIFQFSRVTPNLAWSLFYITSYCHVLAQIRWTVLQYLTWTERQFVESIFMILIKPALSNPFATRHIWRMAILMWRMTLILNTSKIGCFCTKSDICNLIHIFLSKKN